MRALASGTRSLRLRLACALPVRRLRRLRLRLRPGRRLRPPAGHPHRRPVLQPVRPIHHHPVADRQSLGHHGPHAVALAGLDGAHRDLVLARQEIDVGARRAPQHGRRRHERRVAHRIHVEAGIDELVGKQPVVLVGKQRPQLHRAGRHVDLVVDGIEVAPRDLGRVRPVEDPHRQGGPGAQAVHHPQQHGLGQGEQHRDRMELRDDDDAGRGGGDVVALVDLAQADPALDRRGDAAVRDVELLLVDLRLVGGDDALVLLDRRGLRVDVLLRDRILPVERLVAGEVEAGVLQQRLVAQELALVLRQQRLVGPHVDLGQEVAGLDGLALAKADLGEVAAHLRADRHGGERRHGAEAREHHRHVALLDRGDADRLRPLPARAAAPAAAPAGPGLLRLGALEPVREVGAPGPVPPPASASSTISHASPRPRRRGGASTASSVRMGDNSFIALDNPDLTPPTLDPPSPVYLPRPRDASHVVPPARARACGTSPPAGAPPARPSRPGPFRTAMRRQYDDDVASRLLNATRRCPARPALEVPRSKPLSPGIGARHGAAVVRSSTVRRCTSSTTSRSPT